LHAELDTTRSKLAEVEHHEQALTSENEALKKDLENAGTAHDVVVKDKAEV
jgi:regulator of replication initiation timing